MSKAFTPTKILCVTCEQHPAEPGELECEACLVRAMFKSAAITLFMAIAVVIVGLCLIAAAVSSGKH